MASPGAGRVVTLLGDWRGDGPAHGRLAATLRSLILDGRLPIDALLPPERSLAAALAVSRATVNAAYDQLRREGYLLSRQGSGTWVRLPQHAVAAPMAGTAGGGLDLRVASLPAPPVLEELALGAARELPRWFDHHGYEPLGLPPLRAAIAARFSARGVPTRADEVLVTGGALHALDLVVRTVLRRGEVALAESPSYPAALDLLRGAGARLRWLPVGADGWDLAALAGHRTTAPALAYLIPEFQNPTGALMDDATRRRVAGAFEGAGTVVVADETFAELWLDEPVGHPPLAAYGGGRIVTVGSLSKVAWAGLRVGWVRAERSLIHRLGTTRALSTMASPVLDQLVAVQVLDELDAIAADRRAIARRGRSALAAALAADLPTWRYVEPPGGLFVWAELPGAFSTALAVDARSHQLLLTPGSRFGEAGLFERFLRLPFTLGPDRIAQAVHALAQIRPGRRAHPHGEASDYVA